MRDYNLGFISNENIYSHVKETVKKYRFSVDLAEFNRNLVDPIKLTFDTRVYRKDIEFVIESEVLRQIDKSNTNHIGYFHQNIFQYLGHGWEVPAQGYDIINTELKYFIEIKNKHNTMNSSSAQKTYMRMQNTLLSSPEAICLLVEVIARKSQNVTWRVSLDGQTVSNERIRRVSIDKFYELVTGNRVAFRELCEKLPLIIQDVVEDNNFEAESNSVFKELRTIDPNLLKSIYLLSFREYEGFNDFNV
ncbi:type II restriction enzyme eco47ii [Gloeomargarita lithophora Alchichica-D10]|uniref:Type II restriction enzyme eco47ii n=1 Tax=Gloeomargarita lithophora Alchichica-D10 TaxID=1188229 RepID=A0A1J0AFK6_9CYAN|nr:Eco47II family restriction endonuclease [Gloeomargarita lithophora]APB34683.1 type II restriction enzyme eco47ii [Gloeomargarita lithophora Alchichica-D10]